jgi:hypothetical protein
MDDFLKRPRGSRMPVRNRAFLDVSDFRRALCYAMGDQWTGLSITSDEFESLYTPYIRNAGHESFGIGNVQNFKHAEPLILWQQFARDVQKSADGSGLSAAAARAAEAMRDADETWGDAKNAMEARQRAREAKLNVPFGNRGATLGQVEHAKKVISDQLLMKHDTVREALKDLDESSDGTLTRDEIMLLLKEQYIMKYTDFYTGMTRGMIDEVRPPPPPRAPLAFVPELAAHAPIACTPLRMRVAAVRVHLAARAPHAARYRRQGRQRRDRLRRVCIRRHGGRQHVL